MIATREHVLTSRADLDTFLQQHALHKFYGGENAFLLPEYLDAMRGAGLRVDSMMAPLDSPINYFPMTIEQHFVHCTRPIADKIGQPLTNALFSRSHPFGRFLFKRLVAAINARDNTPGRLYSFLAARPKDGNT
jgi:hypothetical protein